LELSKILVAVDDSKYSDKAFEYAVSIIHDLKKQQQLLIVHIIGNLGNMGYSNLNQLKQDSQIILKRYITKA
jgi:nucleotide-binding universal stress UspA family protein